MSQMNMCLKCFEPVEKGWKMVHHMKNCKGEPAPDNFTQVNALVASYTSDDPYEAETEVPDPNDDQRQDKPQDLQPGVSRASDQVGLMPVRVKPRVTFGPKTLEILEFLATAEMGEGSSREHAQGWLDYQKKKGGASATILPKDIRTCWKHVAKVIWPMFSRVSQCPPLALTL
jgi:hypothetical protein